MKRIDNNHLEIVCGLRGIGATVQSLAVLGKGCPDLLVGLRGRNYLFEVKNPLIQASRRRQLTPDEKKWHETWNGSVHIIENFDDALSVITSA